jgi:hypothetical protein
MALWLIRRLHGVDGVEIRCQVAVVDELWNAIHRRFGRVVSDLQCDAVLLHGADQRLGGALIRIRIVRRTTADHDEVVEKRTAECTGEEVVGEHVALGDVPQRQPRAIVMAHDQTAGVRIGHEVVVLAAIDLHLVLIEAMPQIMGGDCERLVESFRVVDRKQRVGQMLGLRLSHRRRNAWRRQATPDRRELLERGSVAIELPHHIGGHVLQPVRAREVAVEVIEAAIFRVDDYDRLDLVEVVGCARRSAANRQGAERERQEPRPH